MEISQASCLFAFTSYFRGLFRNRTEVNAFAERRLNHSPKRPNPPIFTNKGIIVTIYKYKNKTAIQIYKSFS